MRKKIKVEATVIATVWVDEDINGNQEISDFEDIEEVIDWQEKYEV